ncbi:MAG TPA: phage terminase small subunit P27 family [Saprospiraceae bacterium]|nr:phage terminase small subunit P27 family [Saprospiraceae bacterium]
MRKNEGRAVHAVIKKLRGTYRPDRDGGKLEPPSMNTIPLPPEDYDDDTKEVWFSITEALNHSGLMQRVGIPQIKIYCDQYAIYRDCIKDIKKTGRVIKVVSKNGTTVIKRNPNIDISVMAAALMSQVSDKFGFNPYSQSRIKHITDNASSNKEEADEFDNI